MEESGGEWDMDCNRWTTSCNAGGAKSRKNELSGHLPSWLKFASATLSHFSPSTCCEKAFIAPCYSMSTSWLVFFCVCVPADAQRDKGRWPPQFYGSVSPNWPCWQMKLLSLFVTCGPCVIKGANLQSKTLVYVHKLSQSDSFNTILTLYPEQGRVT